MRVAKSYRGISKRLAVHYLEGLGGERIEADVVSAPEWRAELSTETVSVGPTLELTEVTVAFEGAEEVLPEVVEAFGKKAMRAGG